MTEKGEKGFSLPKGGGKSSLKSPAPLKGKDDSSAKAKSGRKVQFDSEESKINSKSGGKAYTPIAKGDWGKGGKGGKVAKGSSRLELKIDQELPKNAECLMDCEVADILQGIQEQMAILSEDPTIKIPIAFDRGLQYAKSVTHYTSSLSVRRVLEPLKKHGVSDSEICMTANISPESMDEVFALIPSLKGKKNELKGPLKDALSELAKLKHSA